MRVDKNFNIDLVGEKIKFIIEEIEITYFHHHAEKRQIVVESYLENAVVMEGDRGNFIVRYLKQFMTNY